MEFIAHISNDGKVQTVKEHSEATAEMCKDFSIPELKDLAYTIGLYHDVGKYRKAFQKRIRDHTTVAEHSICGAVKLQEVYPNSLFSFVAQLCIAGHHTGIPDCGTIADTDEESTLIGRLKHCKNKGLCNDLAEEVLYHEVSFKDANLNAVENYIKQDCKTMEDAIEKVAFITRYCFSCLTDADTLDTIKATKGTEQRTLTADFDKCLYLVENKLNSFKAVTQLQKARAVLQKQAFENIENPANVYLMNMPTGSGKTLAGLYCALKRAVKTNKKRIIYVIPYNSIIEQTADIFEEILGDKAQLLRHNSTFSYEDRPDLSEDYINTAKYASENWDAQIIITTAVQFFESIYANKRAKLRKVHNMADSIIVLDEAHLMPLEYLQPCLKAIAYITTYLKSEALFLTATMPDFSNLIKKYALDKTKIVEMITDKTNFGIFSKCSYTYLGEKSDEAILAQAMNYPSCLIVTNSRKGARDLYKLCGGKKYHLSTYMTAFDRSRVISEIRQELDKLYIDYPTLENVPEQRRITVISTSLIEAGVDLDFVTVFRELTGLDSILQAGGRCNREGKRKNADVFVFERENSDFRNADMAIKINITKGIIKDYEDISSQQAIHDYYERLFNFSKDKIIQNSITENCKRVDEIPFATYAKNFRLIDDKAVSIVITRDEEGRRLVDELKTGFPNTRKLQKYTCSVYEKEFEELLRVGVLNDYETGIYCLTNPDYYDESIGIVFDGKDIYQI